MTRCEEAHRSESLTMDMKWSGAPLVNRSVGNVPSAASCVCVCVCVCVCDSYQEPKRWQAEYTIDIYREDINKRNILSLQHISTSEYICALKWLLVRLFQGVTLFLSLTAGGALTHRLRARTALLVPQWPWLLLTHTVNNSWEKAFIWKSGYHRRSTKHDTN